MSDPNASPHETCTHFRLKTDFYDNDATGRPEHEACPEYPWCEKTAREIGPDESPVVRRLCRPGRRCFEAVLPQA